MDTRRLLRISGPVFAAVALLISGCSSGTSTPDASASSRTAQDGDGPGGETPANASSETLKPLPTALPATLKPYYGQKLTWRECGVSGFECATMKAPLDYAKAGAGDDVKLAVARKKATGPGKRLGSLMVNPGGPGGSAIGYLQAYAGIGYPAPVRARYDMVAMDPRGVARSEPIECLSDKQMDTYTQVDQTPDDQGEVNGIVDSFKDFAAGCQKRSGRMLGHVSTNEAARDMDMLRAVLGDEKLTYVGASYGTFLGATYAGLYPARAGRLVLDGAMDPSLPSEQLNRDQTGGFETAFTAFTKDCVRTDGCPLGKKSAKDAAQRMRDFFRKLDAKPVPTGETRKLGESLATTAVISAMYDEASWPTLREALQQARDGDGAGLLKLADIYYEREANGSYANLMFANPAVNCLDLPPSFSGPDAVKKALPSFEKASPTFGAGLAWAALNCSYWKADPTGKPNRIEAEGAAPIVVVGTTRDPATPYKWAQSLAAQLDSGTLLTYEGDGHTAYKRGSDCIDTAINTYLLEGKAPANGKKCT
ncbi:alpha/beta hydrolase [Streptomyces sp. H27-D2]|uniref:alpha/beta hydrolase n=1 Tax=Streptomyces sp. H27-D2 TaxID=3046304 RepID=UPI002DB891AE|nr:alpha/beta hydrolase [Streptomyces sp. H27-D2]MEC4015016.1 alpha/beta hydrolase [Streptomyces sp. H27-D2]